MMERRILVIDDEESMRWVIRKALEKEGNAVVVAASAEEGLRSLEQSPFPLAIVDIRMPGMSGLECLDRMRSMETPPQVIVMTAQATMQNAIEAMKRGAFDYLTKPFDMEALKIIVARAWRVLELNSEVEILKGEIRQRFEAGTVVGESARMQEIFKTIGRIADRDVTVLLTGESGTGKELIARAIHYNSRRLGRPFVPVNLAAIPGELLESELFGHEKGAFTGAASQKIGKFEQASGGTLFLDEIGDLAPHLQTKLLRVLQEKEIERVGGSGPLPVDVRVVAATNSNLEEKVRTGGFREDLYFRLNVVPIRIPPLRERREDIPVLLSFFLERARRELDSTVTGYTPDALEVLLTYDWPGNVRELENLIKRAVVLTSGRNLTSEAFASLMKKREDVGPSRKYSLDVWIRDHLSDFVRRMVRARAGGIRKLVLDRVEAPLIEMVLREVNGNQIKAAELLGMNRNTLRKRIREYGISVKNHRPAGD